MLTMYNTHNTNAATYRFCPVCNTYLYTELCFCFEDKHQYPVEIQPVPFTVFHRVARSVASNEVQTTLVNEQEQYQYGVHLLNLEKATHKVWTTRAALWHFLANETEVTLMMRCYTELIEQDGDATPDAALDRYKLKVLRNAIQHGDVNEWAVQS